MIPRNKEMVQVVAKVFWIEARALPVSLVERVDDAVAVVRHGIASSTRHAQADA